MPITVEDFRAIARGTYSAGQIDFKTDAGKKKLQYLTELAEKLGGELKKSSDKVASFYFGEKTKPLRQFQTTAKLLLNQKESAVEQSTTQKNEDEGKTKRQDDPRFEIGEFINPLTNKKQFGIRFKTRFDPKEYAMFRVLVPDAGDEDIRMFKNMAMKNRAEAYQESVDAVFQVSVSVNKETYARLRREDPDMYEALKELMKDEFIATEEKGIEQGDRNRIMQQVRKKMAKNKSFDQIVEECESTPEEIRPIYTWLLSEFQN